MYRQSSASWSGVLEAGFEWDLAVDTPAHFLAVASLGSSQGNEGISSAAAPAFHETVQGGHAGAGVVSLHGAPLATPASHEFCSVWQGCESCAASGRWSYGSFISLGHPWTPRGLKETPRSSR